MRPLFAGVLLRDVRAFSLVHENGAKRRSWLGPSNEIVWRQNWVIGRDAWSRNEGEYRLGCWNGQCGWHWSTPRALQKRQAVSQIPGKCFPRQTIRRLGYNELRVAKGRIEHYRLERIPVWDHQVHAQHWTFLLHQSCIQAQTPIKDFSQRIVPSRRHNPTLD